MLQPAECSMRPIARRTPVETPQLFRKIPHSTPLRSRCEIAVIPGETQGAP